PSALQTLLRLTIPVRRLANALLVSLAPQLAQKYFLTRARASPARFFGDARARVEKNRAIAPLTIFNSSFGDTKTSATGVTHPPALGLHPDSPGFPPGAAIAARRSTRGTAPPGAVSRDP